jgi:integrase/recombinase XerD
VTNELVSTDGARGLSSEAFAGLSDLPPELEWLANITNEKTRRFYKADVAEFLSFTGIREHVELRTAARAHVIAWRKDLESRSLSAASIRRKLSALSSLFDYLCEHNAVLGNPVDGVKRPMSNSNEGGTPALGDAQARRLLEAPAPNTLKGVRDRAILATLLYHGIRREELCLLRLRDMQSRQGVMHFRIQGQTRQNSICAYSRNGAPADSRRSGSGEINASTVSSIRASRFMSPAGSCSMAVVLALDAFPLEETIPIRC